MARVISRYDSLCCIKLRSGIGPVGVFYGRSLWFLAELYFSVYSLLLFVCLPLTDRPVLFYLLRLSLLFRLFLVWLFSLFCLGPLTARRTVVAVLSLERHALGKRAWRFVGL